MPSPTRTPQARWSTYGPLSQRRGRAIETVGAALLFPFALLAVLAVRSGDQETGQ